VKSADTTHSNHNKESETGISKRIYEYIAGNLLNGTFPPGSRLPGMRAFSAKFNCSVKSVECAVKLLIRSGALISRAREGVFVSNTDALTKAMPVKVILPPDSVITSSGLLSAIFDYCKRPVKIITASSFEEYSEMIADGAGDLVFLSENNANHLAACHMLSPLQKFIEKIEVKNIDSRIFSYFCGNGRSLYFVPFVWAPSVMICNTDLISPSDIPETWKEISEYFNTHKLIMPDGTSAAGFDPFPLHSFFELLIYQHGGKIISNNGYKCLLNKTHVLPVLEILKKHYRQSGIINISGEANPEAYGINFGDKFFSVGRIACLMRPLLFSRSYVSRKNMAAAAVNPPVIKKTSNSRYIRLTASCLAVPRKSLNIKAAAEIMKNILSADIQRIIAAYGTGVPVYADVRDYRFEGPFHMPGFTACLRYAQSCSWFMHISRRDIYSVIKTSLESFINNFSTSAQTLDHMRNGIQTCLDKQRLPWKLTSAVRRQV